MIVFPSILGLSLVGIFFLAHRYFGEVKSFSRDELKKKLQETPSVRSEILDKFIFPIVRKFREAILPSILHLVGSILNKFRFWVSKLETRLGSVSKEIHGRAVNLEISQKSEYWQNLNGSGNRNGDDNQVLEEDVPPEREIHVAKLKKTGVIRKKIIVK